jgi:hypothetical protein
LIYRFGVCYVAIDPSNHELVKQAVTLFGGVYIGFNVQQNAGPAFRLLLGRMLADLVRRHAPENLGVVPGQYHPTEAV